MSPIETLMVLGLGSALTFLFFLMFGRVFWNMAMSAGARRNAQQVPVQMLELQADRDRLRAEHAMMARKLELRLDDARTRMTEQMAEVSRTRNRIQSLLHDMALKDDDIRDREKQISHLSAKLESNVTQLEATHQTVENLVSEGKRKDEVIGRQQMSLNRLQSKLAEKESVAAKLSQDDADDGKDAAVPAALPEPSIEGRLRQRVAQLTAISSDISHEVEAEKTRPPAGKGHSMLKSFEAFFSDNNAGYEAPGEKLAKQSEDNANVISLAQRIRALQRGMNE